jgi:hypothetical protein
MNAFRLPRSLAVAVSTLGLGLAALAVGGCDRTYLTPSHGRAYRQSFAAQTANPTRRSQAAAVYGLDSQEAAIISSNYRKALAPKEEASSNQTQLLMYSPRNGLREASVPPPSVPADR